MDRAEVRKYIAAYCIWSVIQSHSPKLILADRFSTERKRDVENLIIELILRLEK